MSQETDPLLPSAAAAASSTTSKTPDKKRNTGLIVLAAVVVALVVLFILHPTRPDSSSLSIEDQVHERTVFVVQSDISLSDQFFLLPKN